MKDLIKNDEKEESEIKAQVLDVKSGRETLYLQAKAWYKFENNSWVKSIP